MLLHHCFTSKMPFTRVKFWRSTWWRMAKKFVHLEQKTLKHQKNSEVDLRSIECMKSKSNICSCKTAALSYEDNPQASNSSCFSSSSLWIHCSSDMDAAASTNKLPSSCLESSVPSVSTGLCFLCVLFLNLFSPCVSVGVMPIGMDFIWIWLLHVTW